MRSWVILLMLTVLSAQAQAENFAGRDLDMARFRALSRARTLSEFEATRRRYDLADAAMLACSRELATGRVPVNCFVILKIDAGLQRNLPISMAELGNLCEQGAGHEAVMPRPEHLLLLPPKCAGKLRERSRLLAYKFGSDLE